MVEALANSIQHQNWAAFLVENRDWLGSIFMGRLRCQSSSEDLMGELFAESYQWIEISQVECPRNWVYRLATRKVYQHLRRKGVEAKAKIEYKQQREFLDSEVQLDTPLEVLLCKEKQELIQSALKELHPEQVDLLMLKYIHNWDYSRIGETIGASHFAVANRLRNARSAFRSAILKHDIEL